MTFSGKTYFRASKLKALKCLLLCGIFVAIGFFIFKQHPFVGIMEIGFFGLGVLIALVSMLPGCGHLRLSQHGFEIRSLYRTHFLKWEDVTNFYPIVLHRNQMVGFDYSESYLKHGGARLLARAMAGCEGALPETYGMKAAELADLMSEWKMRASPAQIYDVLSEKAEVSTPLMLVDPRISSLSIESEEESGSCAPRLAPSDENA